MTTILVTGATGTVGSEVIKQLVSSSSSSDNDIIIRAAFSLKIKLIISRSIKHFKLRIWTTIN